MTERFLTLVPLRRGTGADGILFTCSAFGPCIEAVAAEQAPMPVLKPNEAMIEEAVAAARQVAGRAPAADRPGGQLRADADQHAAGIPGRRRLSSPAWRKGRWPRSMRGDGAAHDRLAARRRERLAECDVVALAQFSLARAAARWRRRPDGRSSPRRTARCASCAGCGRA